MIRSSIHNTRATAAIKSGTNMCLAGAWDALVRSGLGFTGYQPKAGEQDRPEQII